MILMGEIGCKGTECGSYPVAGFGSKVKISDSVRKELCCEVS
jgi:hypothetical protein